MACTRVVCTVHGNRDWIMIDRDIGVAPRGLEDAERGTSSPGKEVRYDLVIGYHGPPFLMLLSRMMDELKWWRPPPAPTTLWSTITMGGGESLTTSDGGVGRKLLLEGLFQQKGQNWMNSSNFLQKIG